MRQLHRVGWQVEAGECRAEQRHGVAELAERRQRVERERVGGGRVRRVARRVGSEVLEHRERRQRVQRHAVLGETRGDRVEAVRQLEILDGCAVEDGLGRVHLPQPEAGVVGAVRPTPWSAPPKSAAGASVQGTIAPPCAAARAR